MNKTLTAIAATGALIALSACTRIAPAETITLSAPPKVDTKAAEVVRLLEGVGINYVDVEMADSLATSICDALDSGMEPWQVAKVGMDSGLSQDHAAATVAASIIVYCPQYEV